jgi:methylated-DNA-protein-cysteine methyltransferase-like protein
MPTMSRKPSQAFVRIRAEVIRLVALIPPGRFTTYGSIAVHMNDAARHVAFVLSNLTAEESQTLPWHRVVASDARLSPRMADELRAIQQERLASEGLVIDPRGYIQDSDACFHPVGLRRDIRWDAL